MESNNASKETLEAELVKMEDWYKAVIFDQSNKVIASKNVKNPDEKELG